VAGYARINLTVSEGVIPNGTNVYITGPAADYPYYQGKVVGYIAQTDAYLCDLGRNVRAFPASHVLRLVPKFTSIEEADAWMEGRST